MKAGRPVHRVTSQGCFVFLFQKTTCPNKNEIRQFRIEYGIEYEIHKLFDFLPNFAYISREIHVSM